MPFSDPIVGGTTLIREAIRSPNFVTGVSGWSINRDGTAEFNNVAVRGDLLVGVSPSPRIYVGSSIPAPLAAASTDFTWTAAIIEYWNAASFRFDAIGTYNPGPFPVRATGTYDSTTGKVVFHEFNQGPGSGQVNAILYGSDTYNVGSALSWTWRNGITAMSSTSGIQNDGTITRPTGNQAYWLTGNGFAAASAPLALTGVGTVVPGCSLSMTSHFANAMYEVDVACDITAGSAAFLAVGQARFNGGTLAQQAVFGGNTTSDRGTVVANYQGFIGVAGTYTFDLIAARAAGAGGTVNATHTTIRVRIYE